MRSALASVAAAIILSCCSGPQDTQKQIAFVGCPGDGQTGPIDAPHGAPKAVALDEVPADEVAYYRGEQARGAFAPRGWQCRVWYGSSGSTLVVAPAPIDGPSAKLHDQAVEMSSFVGGTSGRFAVATYASRLFPAPAAAFIQKVKGEGFEPAAQFERGPYTTDSVEYLNSLTAAFTTPARTAGLGTAGHLEPSQDAVRGVAVLDTSDPAEPDMSIVRVRLGSNRRHLAAAVLRLNRECIQRHHGC
jgi:hypothetical protein